MDSRPGLSNIYSNALEIIFSFLPLHDLSRLMATQHRINSFLSSASRYNQLKVHLRLRNAQRYGQIFRSTGLRRRITTLTLDRVSPHARIAVLFSHLEEFHYLQMDTRDLPAFKASFSMTPDDAVLQESLVWPRQLKKLRISAHGHSRSNQILVDLISRFRTLTQLDISITHDGSPGGGANLDVTPLHRLERLQSLTFVYEREFEFFCVPLLEVLPTLPSLRALDVTLNRESAEFLAQLPHLTELRFVDNYHLELSGPADLGPPDQYNSFGLTADEMLPLLQGLNQLTSLELQHSKLTSNHLALLLPQLPLLTHLALVDCEHLGSSDFLATPSLANTLTHLTLVRSFLSDVTIKPLKALTHLVVVITAHLTPEDLLLWRPIRPRWQDPLGGAQPNLVDFKLLVGDVDAFANVT